MKKRVDELYREKTLDNSGTLSKDLSYADPITAIDLYFTGQAGTTSNKGNWMSDVVTAIEVVDGSDVLFSLSLKEAQAIQYWLTKNMPTIDFEEVASGTSRDNVRILFGRHMWDKEYALDLKKFNNPTLKIVTDEDVIRAMGNEGFLSGSFKLSAWFHMIEEPVIVPKGFVYNKEIKDFTAAANGEEPVDLDRNYPYLGIMLHSTQKGYDINEVIEKIKISCDANKFVPIEMYVKDLQHILQAEWPLCYHSARYFRANAETLYSPIYYILRAAMTANYATHVLTIRTSWSGSIEINLMKHADQTYETTEQDIKAAIFGTSLHNTAWIPFGVEDPEEYFNAPDYGDIDLILTQTGEYNCKIVTSQMRSY